MMINDDQWENMISVFNLSIMCLLKNTDGVIEYHSLFKPGKWGDQGTNMDN